MKDKLVKIRLLLEWVTEEIGRWHREVWLVDLDSRYCCDGRNCCCGGETYRDIYCTQEADHAED